MGRCFVFELRRVLAGLTLIGGVSATTAAMAQGAPNWTGPYIGIGGGATSMTMSKSVSIDFAPPYLSDSSGGKGLIGTFAAGYDHKLGNSFVAGVSIDYDLGKTSALTYDAVTGGVPINGKYETKKDQTE